MTTPLAAAQPIASGQVVPGDAGFIGGLLPVTLVQMVASSLRAANPASTALSPPKSRQAALVLDSDMPAPSPYGVTARPARLPDYEAPAANWGRLVREAALVTLRVLAFVAGFVAVALTAASAVRTVVLPRAVPAQLTRVVFLGVRGLYRLRLGGAADYERRDAVMASYAPVSLLVLLQVWLALVWLGYAAMLWAAGAGTTWYDLVLSGSSLMTLGFVAPPSTALTLLAISEAAAGLVLLALLITYLPSLYAAFSRREVMVAKLAVRAGEPPSGAELLIRASVLSNMEALAGFFSAWEDWFIELEETHTSFPALSFFRSPQPDQSWVTAAGAVLDGASLRASTVDAPREVTAELTIRAGYLALRRIAAFYGLPHPEDPAPTDPITVGRDEYDAVCSSLEAAGVRLRPDREAAWRAFAGWRVNYDVVLVELAAVTMAPYAPWSSDRSLAREPKVGLFRRTRLSGREAS